MLDASLAWRSALVERLEVVSDLIVEVAGHLLPRDRVLHRLAVLSDDSEVLEPRGHAAAAPGQVRVVAVLAALARLALDADVERIGAQTLGRFALGRATPALTGHEPLTLAEILVLRAHSVAPRAVLAAPAALGLAPAAQALARPLLLVHRPHLVERLLHGFEGPIALAALERLHPFHRVAAPVAAALAAEPLHLLEELAELLRRDLVGSQAARQRLGLAIDHLVLAVREVRLEIRHAIGLLQHPEPLVALLHEAVEVGARIRERGVLEDGRQIAGRRGAATAGPLREVALLERRPLERVLGELTRRLLEHRRARPLLALFLGGRQEVRQAARRQRDRRRDGEHEAREDRQREQLAFTRDHALDDALELEAFDARDGVADQRVDEPRPVGPVGPLQGGGDSVVEAEGPVGHSRDVAATNPPRRPVADAHQEPEDHQPAGDPRRPRADPVLGQHHGDAGDGAPEGAAQTVVFGPPAADLPPDAPQEPFDPWRIGHEVLPRLAEKGFAAVGDARLGIGDDPGDQRVGVDTLGLAFEV